MSKNYFYGPRGSGKTAKLLKLAVDGMLDKKHVVFIIRSIDCKNIYKDKLHQMYSDRLAEAFFNEIEFVTASEVVRYKHISQEENTRYFIDESQDLLRELLFNRCYNPHRVVMTFDADPEYSEELVPTKAEPMDC